MRHLRTAAAISAVLFIAACSAKESPPVPTTEPAPTPASHGSLAECLKAHGVPDAGGPAAVLGPPAGVDQGVWDAAMKACSMLAPGPAAP